MNRELLYQRARFTERITPNPLLPAVPVVNPKDADGNTLHEGDRVYSYDHTDNGYQRVYGTLQISDTKETFGHWCVEYDDGECFMVLDFNNVWSARLA